MDQWLHTLEAVPDGPPAVIDPADCARVGIPDVDVAEMRVGDLSPQAQWITDRASRLLTAHLGDYTAPLLAWPAVTDDPYLPAYAHLAALPAIRAWHASMGVPQRVSDDTLAALGEHVRLHRVYHGRGGVDAAWWLTSSYRGWLYRLGRLQFNRMQLGVMGPKFWERSDEPGFRHGDHVLSVHIPAGPGFTPAACHASLREAAEFFGRVFPTEDVRLAICSSWLLDPQLAEYLPDTSNIVQFQRLFTLVPGEADGTSDVFRFALRRLDNPPIEELPERTTLERAIVRHLRAGRRWHMRTGYLRLRDLYAN